jgi:hypothetical protein
MEDEMIEHAARAVYEEFYEDSNEKWRLDRDWDDLEPKSKDRIMKAMRGVQEAMETVKQELQRLTSLEVNER